MALVLPPSIPPSLSLPSAIAADTVRQAKQWADSVDGLHGAMAFAEETREVSELEAAVGSMRQMKAEQEQAQALNPSWQQREEASATEALLSQAEGLLQRVAVESELRRDLVAATVAAKDCPKNATALQSATEGLAEILAQAVATSPEQRHRTLEQALTRAKQASDQVGAELAAMRKLEEAVEARDVSMLNSAIAEARAYNLDVSAAQQQLQVVLPGRSVGRSVAW